MASDELYFWFLALPIGLLLWAFVIGILILVGALAMNKV